jgi:uncharacterized protein DUF1254
MFVKRAIETTSQKRRAASPAKADRYFSVQLIDAYTFNFDYIGSRTTGNDGGSFLVAGPGWKGETPKGVKKVLHSETEFVMGAQQAAARPPVTVTGQRRRSLPSSRARWAGSRNKKQEGLARRSPLSVNKETPCEAS